LQLARHLRLALALRRGEAESETARALHREG
jgi:hypothetical protein